MGRFTGTNPDGTSEIALNEVITFFGGVVFLLIGAYLRYIDLYNAKWDINSSIGGALIATFIMGLVFPSIFPSHPWYEHAEKYLGEVIGMTRVQWFIGLVVVLTYNFFLEQGRYRFEKYESLTPMGMAQLGNLLLLGTSIIPGLMVIKVPDWWAMRQYFIAQKIKYVDLKLRDKEFQLEVKKDIVKAYLDAAKSGDPRRMAITGMMVTQILPAGTSGDKQRLLGPGEQRLLTSLINNPGSAADPDDDNVIDAG